MVISVWGVTPQITAAHFIVDIDQLCNANNLRIWAISYCVRIETIVCDTYATRRTPPGYMPLRPGPESSLLTSQSSRECDGPWNTLKQIDKLSTEVPSLFYTSAGSPVSTRDIAQRPLRFKKREKNVDRRSIGSSLFPAKRPGTWSKLQGLMRMDSMLPSWLSSEVQPVFEQFFLPAPYHVPWCSRSR